MKLFWKIYLAVLMVTTAVVFFVAYTVSVSQISDARDQIVDRNKTVGRFLLKEIELGLIEGNWPFETLTELTQGKDFLSGIMRRSCHSARFGTLEG
jgi:hypothetical protein